MEQDNVSEETDNLTFKEIDLSKFRIGTVVRHTTFGKGKVTGIKTGKIMVSFAATNKTLSFPMVIEKGLVTVRRMVSLVNMIFMMIQEGWIYRDNLLSTTPPVVGSKI